jgi:hypothetical protein
MWKPSQFLNWEEPEGSHLLLPAYITLGELTTLIGQGGLGKSRLALWLGISQITGREWCGLKTGGEPQNWTFIGNENSIARFKTDLSKILPNLTPEERQLVDEHLRLPAPEDFAELDLNLSEPATRARIIATIKDHQAGAVIIDPLGNMAPGDISKPHEMREALRLLVATIRQAAPNAAIIILHHSRTGRQNIAQSVGWDAANFASGGKTLFAMTRSQLNLAPASKDDDTKLLLSCAKSNNCERFTTRGLVFSPANYTYSIDEDFNLEAWEAEIEGRARPGQSLCTVAEVTSAVRDGYSTTRELVAHLTEACATSKPTVERVIRKANEVEAIKTLTRGKFILGRKANKYLENKGD